jgi:hypothetical protein
VSSIDTAVPAVRASGAARLGRWTALGPPLGALVAVGAHVVAGARLGERAPSPGEADLAAAALAARGVPLGPVPLPLSDAFAARQLGLVETVLPVGGLGVLDAARWAVLLFGVLGVLLLWRLLRDLSTGPAATTTALVVLGAAPLLPGLRGAVGAGAVAAVWLLVAAVCLSRAGRVTGVVAVLATVAAAATAPLAAALVLGLGAHVAAEGIAPVRAGARVRWAVAALVGALAVLVAVLAAGTGPLAGTGGPLLDRRGTLVVAAVALVLAVLLTRPVLRWLRPLLTPVGLLLVVVLVPGTGSGAAALLLLPVVALVVAVVVEETVPGGLPITPRGLVATGAVLVAAAVAVGVLVTARPTPPRDTAVADWVRGELPPDSLVRADALDRGGLLVAGVPADLLAPAGPAGAGDVALRSPRATAAEGPPPPPCDERAVLAAAPAPGAVLCGDAAAADAADAEAPQRVRLGEALSGNPALGLAPGAAALLREGRVDPRVMLVLTAMASARQLTIADFPAAPLAPDDALRRRVLLTAVDGLPVGSGSDELLAQWLSGQQPPFVPGSVLTTADGLLVTYPASPATGLLPA